MKKSKRDATKLIYIPLILWAVTTIYPFIWVILNSFKPKGRIRSDSFSLPIGDLFTLDNYKTAFERVDIGRAYLNSIVISCSVTILVLLIAGVASYALARYRFKGKGILHSAVIASMMFPVFATIIPVFQMHYGAIMICLHRCFSCVIKKPIRSPGY